MEKLQFTLELKEQKVELSGTPYAIRELNGRDRDAYLDLVGNRVKYVNGVQTGMTSYAGLQSGLLAKCLVNLDTNTAVPESTIASFPSSVLTELFKIAQKLNGLDKEAALDEIKNG
jgi:hypothetical protein